MPPKGWNFEVRTETLPSAPFSVPFSYRVTSTSCCEYVMPHFPFGRQYSLQHCCIVYFNCFLTSISAALVSFIQAQQVDLTWKRLILELIEVHLSSQCYSQS